MLTDADSLPSSAPGIQRVMRPARALIGWMSESSALNMLAHGPGALTEADRRGLIQAAQARVAERRPGVDQTDAVMEPPPELADYIQTLTQHAVMDQFKKEGWTVRLANLRKLCSIQPAVFLDHAAERTRTAQPKDLNALARITLPMEQASSEFSTAYDEARQRFILTSRNPNFRIVGAFNNAMPAKGQMGLAVGFVNVTTLSLLQVVKHRGRYMLRDGNHRALGLLANGIDLVPVLYREYGEFDSMELSHGLFPPKVFLGERPPLLIDYLDDTVASQVALPATQKVVIVQAIETSVVG